MTLLNTVEKALEAKKRSMSWLANELDRTLEGLKLSLKNETIKYSDMKKMVKVLGLPIQILLEGDTTIQNIKGNHNTQANQSMVANDPEVIYKTLEVDGLKKQVELLKSQITDKDKIIELLSKK